MRTTTEIPNEELALALPRKGPLAEPPKALALTVIERKPGWRFVDLRDLWRYRELLFFMVWRDIKVRYKQTALGATWAILQPLATMAVLVMLLGRVARVLDAAIPYSLFLFAGLVPWMFFAAAVGTAGNSVMGNQHLVTKIYFPRLLMPLAAVAAAVVDFLIAFGMLLLIMMPLHGVRPGWSLIALPLVLLVLVMLAVGLGTLLAALTVAYRDFRSIVPLTMQLWMFSTSALFFQDLSKLGPRTRALMPLNPMHGVIVNFRAAVLGGPFDLPAAGISALCAVVLLVIGCIYFRRVERSFADII
ncbi:MAG TPA: ABC transporter permease [Isosphaeraceae bacterium]|nr:ABC transporter permease [Isosphaeraceae bacterium]